MRQPEGTWTQCGFLGRDCPICEVWSPLENGNFAIERNEALTPGTMWMNLENIPRESRHTQKPTSCVIPLIRNAQNKQIRTDRNWMNGVEVGNHWVYQWGRGWEVTADKDRVPS